ncbi:MAG: ferrochelatase [Bacteriovoracaceae bacterium]|nr:ferrochelatase [Bacteriovoracaceae bacterium]
MNKKKYIFLVQLGSPKDPSVKSVRTYLKEFLGDPRLIDLPRILWLPILYLIVLPFRPKKSAEGYARLWNEKLGFPLVFITISFAEKLKKYLPAHWVVEPVFVLSDPRFKLRLQELKEETLNDSHAEMHIIPQYPQYSEATTAAIVDLFISETKTWVNFPSFSFYAQYFSAKCFIDQSQKKINEFLNSHTIDDLLISFHGLPKKRITEKNDDYFWQCMATFDLIVKNISFPKDKIHICFQSQFGRDEWLTPSTINQAEHLLECGSVKLAVYCPSFVVDCLETSIEIGEELLEEMHEHFPQAEITLINCLNDEESWVKDYAHYLKIMIEGSEVEKNELHYVVDQKHYQSIVQSEIQKDVPKNLNKKKNMTASEPLSPHSKKTLLAIFVVVFLDLLGFSIIFPLIPAIANHYLAVDSENYFLKLMWEGVYAVGSLVGAPIGQGQALVLFGCMLGAIYSFLQFFATTFWGNLSDKIGRKKILLFSTCGMVVSYAVWFFSGSFTLLILSRFIGGLMSGNISVASAAIADVTTESQRSKGMAYIGIAFALGFVFGPAIGGLSALFDFTKHFPELTAYGVNPFSAPALIAFILAFVNVILVNKLLKETWVPTKAASEVKHIERTINLFKILKPLPYPGVNLVNITYFLFIAIFSGMEFTLTFLTVERLNYLPVHNGMMFVFIGFMIAMVQGGFVRRRANQLGEAKVSLLGLFLLIPGLILISLTQSTALLLAGLFFLSAGSAMVIPCLTTLVSLYSPKEVQGKSLGVFRSLGAVGRIVGPLAGSLIFWRFGSAAAYICGAVALSIPLWLNRKLVKMA